MSAGGYRPNSGPMPGTKYRPRANKKEKLPKAPKKRGRPSKVKVDIEASVVKADIIKKSKKAVVVAEPIVSIPTPPITTSPTSLAPADIENAAAVVNLTPLDYLLSVMNNPTEDQNIRIRVAGMIAPFIHPKPGERTGKKDEKEEKAKTAAGGKFAPSKQSIALVK